MSLRIVALLLCLWPFEAGASEAIGAGKITDLSYRLEDMLFKVTDSGSANQCAQCAPDASGMAADGYCWVDKANKNLISMVLTAYSSGKQVRGRVGSWSQCSVYQFHISD